jgi:hypothetical protein
MLSAIDFLAYTALVVFYNTFAENFILEAAAVALQALTFLS